MDKFWFVKYWIYRFFNVIGWIGLIYISALSLLWSIFMTIFFISERFDDLNIMDCGFYFIKCFLIMISTLCVLSYFISFIEWISNIDTSKRR